MALDCGWQSALQTPSPCSLNLSAILMTSFTPNTLLIQRSKSFFNPAKEVRLKRALTSSRNRQATRTSRLASWMTLKPAFGCDSSRSSTAQTSSPSILQDGISLHAGKPCSELDGDPGSNETGHGSGPLRERPFGLPQ